ncbi:MAG: SPFH/Band 7/PHB domain protein [Synechococcales cyanobacterium C42_A2020_086]|jgi:regulator of protease activity HflC (stomatin/prohibitin superfamily)|nr:SPFH/Band 7/PHB domain protein [Synechococcales cyanobacterium M58_A2018_015]MBF2073448.1 SPFH/Band 7/PHB domain protein [Synechococcales cyanobacterium C42_A2020_086]
MSSVLAWFAGLNPWILAGILVLVTAFSSTRRVGQGKEAIVERLGRYHRTLKPGLNFGVFPIVDEVVVQLNTREQILEIAPFEIMTADSVPLKVDMVAFWRIIDPFAAHYEIDNVRAALRNLVITTLRSTIGEMDLQHTYAARDKINRQVLESLDAATEPWGVRITRVEVQGMELPETLKNSLEQERGAWSTRRSIITEAEGRKEAIIVEAEGKRKASIQEAEAIAESARRIAEVLRGDAATREALRFLLMREYARAGQRPNLNIEEPRVRIEPDPSTRAIPNRTENQNKLQ